MRQPTPGGSTKNQSSNSITATPVNGRERGPVGTNNIKHQFQNEAELISIMIFIVETLKSVFPEFHPLNMRSTRTLLKYHFRDLAELANRLQLVSMDEEMRKQGGGKGPSEILVKEVGVLTMPLYMVLQGEVSVYKPAPIIVDEKSSPENKKLTSESTKQSMTSYDLPSRNIIMSH